MTTMMTLEVAPNADHDDCLAFAIEEYLADHDEVEAWQVSAEWTGGEDGERETITLTVPMTLDAAREELRADAEKVDLDDFGSSADDGDVLVHFREWDGLDAHLVDPKSLCGFYETELHALKVSLRERGLTLVTDSDGLVVKLDERDALASIGAE